MKLIELLEKAQERLASQGAFKTKLEQKKVEVNTQLDLYNKRLQRSEKYLERIKKVVVASEEKKDVPKQDPRKFEMYLQVAAEDGASTLQDIKALKDHIASLTAARDSLDDRLYDFERDTLSLQIKVDSLNLRKNLAEAELESMDAAEVEKYLDLDALCRQVEELEAEVYAEKTIYELEKKTNIRELVKVNSNSFIQDVLGGKV